jgi:hypothetical protein
MLLHHGIAIVRDWQEEIRRLLRAMGEKALLPRPEGAFPTFTSPEPGAAAPPPVASSPKSDASTPNSGAAAIAEPAALQEIRDLIVKQQTVKEWYSTGEVAKLLGKAEYTVREWCRQGRAQARKRPCGRGKSDECLISHEDLLRLKNEGPLPPPKPS